MKKTKVEHLIKEQSLVGIKVTKEGERPFVVPVMDVRRSSEERERVAATIKAINIQQGSKFFKPSYSAIGRSYNISH